MSIKTNLLITLILVVSVMLATVGYLGWSSIRISRQLEILTPSVAYLEAVSSSRSVITRQMKEVVDCLISNSTSSQEEFNNASKTMEELFAQWESSIRARNKGKRPVEDEELQQLARIKGSYLEWHGLARNVLQHCERNELNLAKTVLSETSYLVLENTLLNEIDSALEDGNNEVMTVFHMLVMSLGRLPWSNDRALQTLERVQATVDSNIAITRINTGISKQLKELMDDLISPVKSLRPFGWAGNETTSALTSFRRSASKLVELGLPNSSRLLSEATTLESQYIKFTVLCQIAMSSRQEGDVQKAAKLADTVIGQVMRDGLTPNLKQSLMDSNLEIKRLSSSVGWQGIMLVISGALFVIITLIASLRAIIKAFTILETETSAITSGNLEHRIELPANTELGRLAASFNSMTESLQKKHSELSDLNAELEKRIEDRTVQLAMANEDLRLFSSSVCHDLRAPLSSISGYSQLLLMSSAGTLDRQTLETLERIVTSSGEMSAIISALMKLARITEDEIICESVDLSLLARLVAAELRERHHGREVAVEIEDGLYARGDDMLLKLVLENLLGNAWKYTSRNEHGSINFGCMKEGDDKIYFVADNGAGFDMEMAGSLFKPFGRLHSSEEFDGTGIGLATVKRIIIRHGGRIWAEGKPGHGASFYFTLGS